MLDGVFVPGITSEARVKKYARKAGDAGSYTAFSRNCANVTCLNPHAGVGTDAAIFVKFVNPSLVSFKGGDKSCVTGERFLKYKSSIEYSSKAEGRP